MPRELTLPNRALLSTMLLSVGFLWPSQLCTGGEAPENPKSLTLEAYLQELGYRSIPLKRTELVNPLWTLRMGPEE